jgi:translation initiation factor IF-3
MILKGRFASLIFLLITNMEVFLINNNRRTTDDAIINDDIKSPKVLVITNEGEKLGILSRNEALAKADEYGLDLVLVSPEAKPPVAKIMDYSKFRFEQQKKLKEMKKNQKVVVIQEIRLSPTIEKHDFETKANNARKMLLKGSKVKVTLRFFGRMIAHQDLGQDVIKRFVDALADCAQTESPIKLDGRSLFTVLVPKNDK